MTGFARRSALPQGKASLEAESTDTLACGIIIIEQIISDVKSHETIIFRCHGGKWPAASARSADPPEWVEAYSWLTRARNWHRHFSTNTIIRRLVTSCAQRGGDKYLYSAAGMKADFFEFDKTFVCAIIMSRARLPQKSDSACII